MVKKDLKPMGAVGETYNPNGLGVCQGGPTCATHMCQSVGQGQPPQTLYLLVVMLAEFHEM